MWPVCSCSAWEPVLATHAGPCISRLRIPWGWRRGAGAPSAPSLCPAPELREMLRVRASGRGGGCSEKSHFP